MLVIANIFYKLPALLFPHSNRVILFSDLYMKEGETQPSRNHYAPNPTPKQTNPSVITWYSEGSCCFTEVGSGK